MDVLKAAAQGNDVIALGVQACPFLRSIVKITDMNLTNAPGNSSAGDGQAKGHCPAQRGPIFCDEPSFESTFRLFHGSGGVVPLKSFSEQSESLPRPHEQTCPRSKAAEEVQAARHPLAASAATISMSAFGGGGPNPFSWDGFMAGRNKQKPMDHAQSKQPKSAKSSKHSEASVGGRDFASQQDALRGRGEHGNGPRPQQAKSRPKPTNASATAEAQTKQHIHGEPVNAHDWLSTSDCPIAKMHRVLLELAPAATEFLRAPQTIKIACPAPIIAARAALAKSAPVRQLRPQPLNKKLLAVGGSTLLVNMPLGMWREHVEKFSPEWFVAVHAAVPFIAMLRKAVLIPKQAMVLTILAAIMGQVIGSRTERVRMQKKQAVQQPVGLLQGGLGGLQFSPRVAANMVQARGVEGASKAERQVNGAEYDDTDASIAGCARGLGALDLFSGKAEEIGWTPSRVKSRGSSCRSNWKLPAVSGLGLSRVARVH